MIFGDFMVSWAASRKTIKIDVAYPAGNYIWWMKSMVLFRNMICTCVVLPFVKAKTNWVVAVSKKNVLKGWVCQLRADIVSSKNDLS